MLIEIADVVIQTQFFIALFLVILLASFRGFAKDGFFSFEESEQIKGLAILAIFFAHLGYSLAADQRYLFPLSVLGGVGVNIFLILSGYGLTVSQLGQPLSRLQFYKKRLPRLFVPMWVVLVLLLLADELILKRGFPLPEIGFAAIGLFPRADLFTSINSPLWYFSLILFYYLIFPLIFVKKYPWLSVVGLVVVTYLILSLSIPIHADTLILYKLHSLAFPLGVLLAIIKCRIDFRFPIFFRMLLSVLLIGVIAYTALESGVGKGLRIEQGVSLVTATSIIGLFVISRIRFGLLTVFGRYSYEVYLIHWPLVSLYLAFLYQIMPPFLATGVSLAITLFLAWSLAAGEKIVRQKIKFWTK